MPALLLIGGSLNGFIVRIVEALATAGFTSVTLGLSPFELIALLVAAHLSTGSAPGQGPETGDRIGWAEAAAMAGILLPSSAAAWAAVAFYAVVHAGRTRGNPRTGALLFLLLALCALWSSVLLKWIAGPVTTAEATVIGHVMTWLRPDIVQSGNVIGNADSHSLILMTACTTANGLPVALLALAAVTLLLGGIPRHGAERRRLAWGAAGLAVLYAVANGVRLGIMTLSSEAYAVTHGPIGANIFDALQTVTVLLLANRVSRP